jgi:hypothetical protein
LLPAASNKQFSPMTIEAMIKIGALTRAEAAATVADFDKPAGERCPHQRHHKGCTIYQHRPFSCRFWNCRWLVNDDTAELRRPSESHYVIDIAPDYVTTRDDAGEPQHVQVVQIWCDPNYPDAHRDPVLRAYLVRQAEKGIAALVRYNEIDALFIAAPALTADGQWHERRPNRTDAVSHSTVDKVRVLGPMTVKMTAKS